MDPPTTNREPQRFALLIGVDYYSAREKCLNLSGCVNDVKEMEKLLDELNVPSKNIRTVLGPKPKGDPSEWQHPTQPTRKDVLDEIEGITSSAESGDFVYFHYSGHGCRAPTKYERKQKAGTTQDEALSLVGQDGKDIIRDVELGARFAEMNAKGIILLAVLDCCHSGGATRIGNTKEPRVRSRGLIEHPTDAEWLQPWSAATHQAPGRNTRMASNWFYHEPGYHFLAACQANQEAREAGETSEVVEGKQLAMGQLTAALIKALRTHHTSMSTTSYRTLDNWLSTHFRTRQQQPLLLGDFDQIIFNLATTLELRRPHPGEATVIKTLTSSLELNRGSADAVKLGDEYRIFPPSETRREGTNFVAQVVVWKVIPLESSARLVEGKGCLDDVQQGWWAKRISRRDSHVTHILVEPPSDDNLEASRAINQLRDEWTDYTDSANVPLNLHFDKGQRTLSTTYQVRISERSEFEILDGAGNALRNMPRITTTDPRMSEKLIAQLTHLQMYQIVRDLAPAGRIGNIKEKYEFDIVEVEDGDQEVDIEEGGDQQENPTLKSFEIKFKNVSSDDLYVTILSLSMLRGVHRAFPIEGEGSQLVEPGKSIVPVDLEIFKPNFLDHKDCSKRETEMVDILKVLVTLEPHNFDHFLLRDLDHDAMEPSRTKEWASRSIRTDIQERDRDTRSKERKPGQWSVDERCIKTVIA